MEQLNREQRYTIFVMYEQFFSITEIAKTINKDKSVVSREIKRNSDEKGRYRFTYAQEMADIRKERLSKPRTFTGEIESRIIRYIRGKQWSPEQIVGYCRLKGYAMVSVERIYQYIRKDKKNGGDVLKAAIRELMPYIGTIKSITTDNGCEFAKHKELAKALKTTVFFAHPYALWEKGAIENTNRPRKNSTIYHQHKFFSNFAKNPLHLEVDL